MASSVVDICNIALGRIGQGQFITSLDEKSAAAQACSVFYLNARDATLEAHEWQFATARTTLGLLASPADELTSEWTYAYELPTDCLAPRYIPVGDLIRAPALEHQVEFALEHDETTDTVVLVTDQADAQLVYTRKVTKTQLYSALFVEALAWKLASELALRLAVKPSVAANMAQGYARALATAGAKDFTKAKGTHKPQASYIRARGGSGV